MKLSEYGFQFTLWNHPIQNILLTQREMTPQELFLKDAVIEFQYHGKLIADWDVHILKDDQHYYLNVDTYTYFFAVMSRNEFSIIAKRDENVFMLCLKEFQPLIRTPFKAKFERFLQECELKIMAGE